MLDGIFNRSKGCGSLERSLANVRPGEAPRVATCRGTPR